MYVRMGKTKIDSRIATCVVAGSAMLLAILSNSQDYAACVEPQEGILDVSVPPRRVLFLQCTSHTALFSCRVRTNADITVGRGLTNLESVHRSRAMPEQMSRLIE